MVDVAVRRARRELCKGERSVVRRVKKESEEINLYVGGSGRAGYSGFLVLGVGWGGVGLGKW